MDNALMETKKPALAYYADNLSLYRLCANATAFLTIVVGILFFILHLSSFDRITMRWIMLASISGTLILLVGRYYFPRLCSACLLMKFHVANAYLIGKDVDITMAGKGVDISLWFTLIGSTFLLMGYVESVQSARIKKTQPPFWLAEPGFFPVVTLLFAGVFLAMVSGGYLYKFILF